MQESHMLESEDEAENEALTGDASYPFLTSDDIRIMPDDSAPSASAPPHPSASTGAPMHPIDVALTTSGTSTTTMMGGSTSMCSEDLMIGSKMSEFHLDTASGVNSPLTSSFIYATPIPPSISIENQNGDAVGKCTNADRHSHNPCFYRR